MRIGIDIGTCAVRAGIWRDGQARLIADPFDQNPSIPAAVFADGATGWLVGHAAEVARPRHPERYQREFKRDLGVPDPYLLGDRSATAEMLLAAILEWVRAEAGRAFNAEPVTGAVVAVPAAYEEYRRNAVRRAATAAGFATVDLIDEPVAAAATATAPTSRRLLVFDFGGGGFNAAVFERTAAGFEAVSRPVGLTDVGGAAFDREIFLDLRRTLPEAGSLVAAAADPGAARALDDIWALCRKVKHQLSAAADAEVWVTQVTPARPYRLTRDRFEQLVTPHIRRALAICRNLWAEVVRSGDEAPFLFLTGGSARVPVVARAIEAEFKVSPVIAAEQDLAVVRGAARRAAELDAEERMASRKVKPLPRPPKGINPFDLFNS